MNRTRRPHLNVHEKCEQLKLEDQEGRPAGRLGEVQTGVSYEVPNAPMGTAGFSFVFRHAFSVKVSIRAPCPLFISAVADELLMCVLMVVVEQNGSSKRYTDCLIRLIVDTSTSYKPASATFHWVIRTFPLQNMNAGYLTV